MPFADSISFTVLLDGDQHCFPKNTLLRYKVVTDSLLQIYNNSKSCSVHTVGTTDISERLTACAERGIIRVDYSDDESHRMELNLLEYSDIQTLNNPLTIVIDDSVLPQLHNVGITNQQEAVNKFRAYFLLRLRTEDSQYPLASSDNNTSEVFAFSIGRERLELVSRSYRIIIDEAPQTHYLHIVDIQKRRNLPEGLIQLIIAPNIVFTDDKSVHAEVVQQSNEIYKSLIQDNSELLSLWSAYNQCEIEMCKQEAKEMGFVKYVEYHKVGNEIRFTLARGTTVSSDFISDDTYYEVISSSDFNEDDYLNSNNMGAIVVGYSPDTKSIGKSVLSLEMSEDAALKSIPHSGVIYPSIRGSVIQSNRRQKAQDMIKGGSCNIPQLKILLQSGQSVGNLPKHRQPITAKLEKTIFQDDKNLHFNDGQKKAISAALNTPDVAIIQGPPGTGKTTVIQAIIERINETENGKARILITSTQHDAVDNASSGVYYNGVPVNRASHRKKAEQKNTLPVYDWIDEMTELCGNWLSQNSQDDCSQRFITVFEKLDSLRNDQSIENLKSVQEHLIANDFPISAISIIDNIIKQQEYAETNQNNDRLVFLRHLNAQRLDRESFLNDGADNLKQLMRYLKFDIGRPELIGESWKALSRTTTDTPELPSLLESFSNDIMTLRTSEEEKSEVPHAYDFNVMLDQVTETVRENAADRIQNHSSSNELYDLIWNFKHELTSIFNVRALIRSYSLINAATCQQAASSNISDTMRGFDEHYDYVIIDEAARSNPLDLMIPMTMGKKLILVGDHKQLPHMLTEDVVKKVIEENPNDSKIGELLKESLFVRLFNLMSSDDQKELRGDNRRVVMLDTQFRMHPDIGTLISTLFYNNKLHNGSTAEDKAHNLGVYRNAALAWLDVPADGKYPHESSRGHSRYRECEVDIIGNQLHNMLFKNPKYKFGIISFYKEQTNLLQQMVDRLFPDQSSRIQVGTVDAFQGKEFDIVFLSTVRSNEKATSKERVGFLDDENRLCVAFSRAKRLLVAVGDASTVTVVNSLNALYSVCKEGNGYYERIH